MQVCIRKESQSKLGAGAEKESGAEVGKDLGAVKQKVCAREKVETGQILENTVTVISPMCNTNDEVDQNSSNKANAAVEIVWVCDTANYTHRW